jgi:hypothetical protein
MLDIRGYGKSIELLYTDRFDIYRSVEVSQGDAVSNIYPEMPHLEDIPCRLSYSSSDMVSGDETRNDVEFTPKLFCNVAVDVIAGDKITIRRCYADGTVYATYTNVTLTAKPDIHEDHLEIMLKIEDDV